MKTSEYVSYFENIARRHKQILHTDNEKHFYRMDIEEVITGLRTDINYKALVLENHEGIFYDKNSDNIYEMQSGAFLVLDNLNSPGDTNLQMQIMDECFSIGVDILSWIRKDRRSFLLKALDINSFKYNKVGPIFDNAYGYRFPFKLDKPNGLKFEPAKWNLD